MKVRIYKPSKSAMQSGHAKSAQWILEYETTSPRKPESLMGWVSSEDTLNQVRMKFDTVEQAVTFAEEKGWDYTIAKSQSRRVKPRNYGDNFRYIPPQKQDAS
ncbi:MAG: ETC complex I subunit [Alphaproteobacteria bacterium]|nr:ETC complex I subunit [Alphaproteobacteria bacterium]